MLLPVRGRIVPFIHDQVGIFLTGVFEALSAATVSITISARRNRAPRTGIPSSTVFGAGSRNALENF